MAPSKTTTKTIISRSTSEKGEGSVSSVTIMDEFGIPPPPQKIFEHLNGHLIGHYIMKKALSVAIYNHFCDINMKRMMPGNENETSAPLVSTTNENLLEKQNISTFRGDHYEYDRGAIKNRKDSNDSGISGESPTKTGTYLTPIVTRVLVEASTHKVRLRTANALTFDPTGSSRPLDAIAYNLANFLGVPYIRCDCRNLTSMKNQSTPSSGTAHALLSSSNPIQSAFGVGHLADRRRSLQPGCLSQLLKGYEGDSLNKLVGRLFKQSGYDVDKTERGIVLLDNMQNLGEAEPDSMRGQIFKEILELIDGTEIKVRKPKILDNGDKDRVTRPNPSFNSNEGELVTIKTGHIFFICFGVNDQDIDNLMQQTKPVKVSLDSGLSPSSSKAINTKAQADLFDFNHAKSNSLDEEDEDEDCSSSYNSLSEDDSFVGLKENKLAKLLMTAENSPIPKCQNLWRMDDVELKILPEALEIIANHATYQGAGVDGVRTILEKLLLTVKFDIPGKNVKMVEITEDFVLGKAPPIYHYKTDDTVSPKEKNEALGRAKTYCNSSKFLTEFDEAIVEGLEL